MQRTARGAGKAATAAEMEEDTWTRPSAKDRAVCTRAKASRKQSVYPSVQKSRDYSKVSMKKNGVQKKKASLCKQHTIETPSNTGITTQ